MTAPDTKLNCFSEISSRLDALPPREELESSIRGYDYVVQYTLDRVEIVEAPGYEGIPDDLLELRAFDADGELHMVDTEEGLKGRIRTDTEGAGTTVFDEEHALWGSVSLDAGGVGEVVLREDRGTVVRLPKSALPGLGESSVATIRVRNYLDEGEVDEESGDTRFAFSDYRFVSFNVREGE